MGYIAQRNTRLDGVDYEPGQVVPDGAVNGTVIGLGLVAAIPDDSVGAILSGWDPSDHTVDEVRAFVGAFPDQRERVLADEKVGEQRATLIPWLEGQDDVDDEPNADDSGGAPASVGADGVDAAPSDADAGDQADQPAPYDPHDYTVAEVLDYAADHPEEIDSIRTAEETGKDRSTLLDGLDELATAPDGAADGSGGLVAGT